MSRKTFGPWCAAMLLAAGTAHAQTIVTQWNFNSNPSDGNTATGTFVPNIGMGTAQCFGASIIDCIFANADSNGGSTDPNVGDDSGWQTRGYQAQGGGDGNLPGDVGAEFSLSTVNYTGIVITWDQRHSNTSSRFCNVFYSIDGVTFIEAPGAPLEGNAGDTWFNQRSVDLSSIAGANNNPNFRLRISPVYDPANPGNYTGSQSTYAPTGTYRFDMVRITGDAITSIPPTGFGQASPGAVCAGGGLVNFQVSVAAGVNPPSTGITVIADLTSVNGSASAALFDDGNNGDAAPGDGIYTLVYTVPGAVTIGPKTIPVVIADSQGRTSGTSLAFEVADCSINSDSRVVISQVYGGGGNPGAIYNADFIELFNRSASPVDLTGWSVQYASAGGVGGFDDPADQVLLSGSIQPGQYLLVQFSSIGANGIPLPSPDFAGTGGIGNSGGRAAIVRDSALIGVNCDSADVEDLAGWGAAICFEGAAAAAGTDNTVGITRKLAGAQDSDQSFNDFEVGTPNARNRASGGFLAGFGALATETVCAGTEIDLSVTVSAAVSPPSTGVQVVADLTQLGGSASEPLSESAGVWSLSYTVPVSTSQGAKTIPLTVSDAQGRIDSSSLGLTVVTCNNSSSRIVVSGFFGGGGNTGSPFAADHIEIFNRSQLAVDLSGWSVQYSDADNATGFIASRVIPLSGSIAAGEYRLIQTSASGANGVPLPTPDFFPATFFGMDNESGRIAIVRVSEVLGTNCASPNIEDLVGYGAAALCFEGLGRTLDISNSTGGYRKLDGCQDFNQNAVDFEVVAPLFLPRNSSAAANVCEGGPAFCDADWCQDGSVGVPDIFCFLSAWFANDPAARNYGGSNGVPAIFAFLSVWFATGTGPCVP